MLTQGLNLKLGDDLRGRGHRDRVEFLTDEAIALPERRGSAPGQRADAAGVAQASWYLRHRISAVPQRPEPVPHRDRAQPRALAAGERKAIPDALHSSAVRAEKRAGRRPAPPLGGAPYSPRP